MNISSINTKLKNNMELIVNIVGAFVIKGSAMIVFVFTLPAYIRYFENQTILGLWFTILSVLSWVLAFDLGIGNGLRNKLTVAIAKKQNLEIKKYISSAYFLVGGFSLIVSLIGWFVFALLDWNDIFNVESSVIKLNTLLYCVRIVFIGLMIQFILRLINSVIYALQKSVLNNLLALISSLIILLYITLFPTSNPENSLIILAYINVLAMNIPLLAITIWIFIKKIPEAKPSLNHYNITYAKAILGIGLVFLLLQFASILIGNTNEFLISKFINVESVVCYQAYYKIFNLFVSLFNLALTPIWSAVTKSFSEKNYYWVIKLHKFLCLLSLGIGCCLFLVIPIFPNIIKLWLGSGFEIRWEYTLTFVLLTILMLWNGANCCIANGLGFLKAQLLFLTFGAVINIPLSYMFSKISGQWISIIYANIISLLPICISQPIYLWYKLRYVSKTVNCRKGK